jgi:uncharacterized membrane protein YhaH (DUF805 family)
MTSSTGFGRRGGVTAASTATAHVAAQRSRPPSSSPSTPASSAGSPFARFVRLFFSCKGRIRRRDYWLGHIAVTAAVYLTIVGSAVLSPDPRASQINQILLVLSVLTVLSIVGLGLWASVALQVKRWHDRDKSWPWLFITLIPFVGGLWLFVELGCLDGTPGDNRFGHSPKLGPAMVFA